MSYISVKNGRWYGDRGADRDPEEEGSFRLRQRFISQRVLCRFPRKRCPVSGPRALRVLLLWDPFKEVS